MADQLLFDQYQLLERFVDMGDGSYARQVYVVGGSTSGGQATTNANLGPTNESVAATPSSVSGLHGLIAGMWTALASVITTLLGTVGLKTYLYDPATGTPFSLTAAAQVYTSNSYANITTATTTQVKNGAGTLSAIFIGTPVANATIAVYDATSGTTNPIGLFTVPATVTGPINIPLNCAFGTGLRITTTLTSNITVSYR